MDHALRRGDAEVLQLYSPLQPSTALYSPLQLYSYTSSTLYNPLQHPSGLTVTTPDRWSVLI